MRTGKVIAWGGVVLLTVAVAGARGSVVSFEGFGAALDVSIQHAGATHSETAGEMNVQVAAAQFIAYCVNLDAGNPPAWDGTIQPVTVINGGLQIAFLYDHFAAMIHAVADHDTRDLDAAALQVAIWEFLDDYPGPINLSGNNFRFLASLTTGEASTAQILNQANFYISQAPANLSGYVPQSVIAFSALGPNGQPQGQNLIIPEPASLSALLVGVGLLLRHRTRR